MADLPDPLVPAEVDLNGLDFMPMRHMRVLQSTLFVKSTGDEFKAAFALWCASWTEIPAGSLPDDDVMLEALSRSKVWKKVKARALHGWIKCSDGRLYHRIIAPLAINAWERRDEYRVVQENRDTRQQRWRERVKQLYALLRGVGVTPPTGLIARELVALCEKHVPGFVDADVDAQPSTHVDAQASTGASTSASTEASTRDAFNASHVDASEMRKTGTVTETVKKIPPKPPKGGRPLIGLKDWLDQTTAKGEKPIPEDDPVFAYAKQVGIPIDFLRLAWLEFRHKHTQPNSKRQKDWRAHFRNAVRNNWHKLWYLNGDEYQLTTVGMQAQRAHEERNAA